MAVVRIGKKQQLDLRPGRLGALPQPTPITQGATQLPLDLGPLPFQFENEFPSLRARLQRLSQFSARPLSALLVFLLGVATLDYALQSHTKPHRTGNMQQILLVADETPAIQPPAAFGSGEGILAAAGHIFNRDQIFDAEGELGPVQIEIPASTAAVKDDGFLRAKLSFIAGLIAAHRPSIENCTEVAKYIVELSSHASMDPFYVAAVISVESRFGESAKSKVGALGLMQLMPNTAKEVMYLNTGIQKMPELRDGRTNIALGIDYLKRLEKKYNGNRQLALAAYNWGPGNIASVKGDFNRAPGDVKKYANSILERSQQWKTHFAKTHNASADMPA